VPIIGEFEAAVAAANPDRESDQFKLNGEVFTIADEVKIVQTVLEAQSGHPTVQPSDSSGGLSTTGPSSRVPSSSGASSWRDTPFGRRELAAHPELYEGLASVEENASRVLTLTG
jgi:hypothetical protein